MQSGAGEFTAKLLINAAGAWVDDVARMAFGLNQMQQTVLYGLHAQAFQVQSQTAHFRVEHADPACCKSGVLIHGSGQGQGRDFDDLGIGDGDGITVVTGRFQAGLADKAMPGALDDDGLALKASAFQRHLALNNEEHPLRLLAG